MTMTRERGERGGGGCANGQPEQSGEGSDHRQDDSRAADQQGHQQSLDALNS